MENTPSPRILKGLHEIASNYDAILCDAWGVIHNGVHLYPDVNEALCQFKADHKLIQILTNAPRPSHVIPGQLDHLGLSRNAYDGVVTSGDATRFAIEEYDGQAAFRLGPDRDGALYEGLNISFTPLEKADFIICTGLFDDRTETPEDYRDLLTRAHQLKLPMICANPDIIVKRGDNLIYCGGALAQLYQELGGQTILCGKPHDPIYQLAYARLHDQNQKNQPIDHRKILVIGDGFNTDILGANKQGLDVLFIAEGIFSQQVRDQHDHLDANLLADALMENGCYADYALDGLKW